MNNSYCDAACRVAVSGCIPECVVGAPRYYILPTDYTLNPLCILDHVPGPLGMATCCITCSVHYRPVDLNSKYPQIQSAYPLVPAPSGMFLPQANCCSSNIDLVCLLLSYTIATVFQLYHGTDMMYEMRRRKLESILLLTHWIFNLPHHIGMV